MTDGKLNVLLTNDDGIDAPGMRALIRGAAPLGNLYVCAPVAEQSAMGHRVTVFTDLRVESREVAGAHAAYAIYGSPADCVKFMMTADLAMARPDLVISGVNNGSNTGCNICYSGTVAAAQEAALFNVPAVAFSLCYDFGGETPDYSAAEEHIAVLARHALNGLPRGSLLNVNVPNGPAERVRGIVVTRQGSSWFSDIFERMGADTAGGDLYRNVGSKLIPDDEDGSDSWAIHHDRISVTPLRFDRTDYDYLDALRDALGDTDENPAAEQRDASSA